MSDSRAGAPSTRPDGVYERVRAMCLTAETALDWIVNPTDDAPPEVLVGHLLDELNALELDLRSARLEEAGRAR